MHLLTTLGLTAALGCTEPPLEPGPEPAQLGETCLPQDEFVRFAACDDPTQCSWRRFAPAPGADVATALEQAIRDAYASTATPRPQPVVYVPAGTYHLTHTVHVRNVIGVTLVGESPGTVEFVWDGPAGEQMFVFDGVNHVKVARLGLDGQRRASVGIQQVRTACPDRDCPRDYREATLSTSANEYSDLSFVGVTHGFVGGDYYIARLGDVNRVEVPPYTGYPRVRDTGQNNDMTVLRRNLFAGGEVGVVIAGANALGWDLWDNKFSGVGTGVILDVAGANLWRNGFERTAVTDLFMHDAQYMDLRENQSSSSMAFVQSTELPRLTLIDNTIVTRPGVVQPPIQVAALELLLLRNRITTPAGVAAVRNDGQHPAVRVSVIHSGNTFSAASGAVIAPASGPLRVLPLGGDVYGTSTPSPSIAAPVAPPLSTRPIDESIAPGMTAAAINQILASVPSGTAVHFRAGQYPLDATLHVAGERNLYLVGDGWYSELTSTRTGDVAAGQPVIDVAAAALTTTQATVRDLHIGYDNDQPLTSYPVTGVRLHATGDRPGLVYIDSPMIGDTTTAIALGQRFGFDQVALRVDHPSVAAAHALVARGAEAAASGSAGTRGIRVYGGTLRGFESVLTLSGWAKAVVEGTDFEVWTQAARFEAPAWATIAGGRYLTSSLATLNAEHGYTFAGQQNFVGTSGFAGGFTFAQSRSTSGLRFADAPAARVLALTTNYGPLSAGFGGPGAFSPGVIAPPFQQPQPPPLTPIACTDAQLVGGKQYALHTWSDLVVDGIMPWSAMSSFTNYPCDDPPVYDAGFVRSMLADLEQAATEGSTWSGCAATDVRVHRLDIEGPSGIKVGDTVVARPFVTGIEVVRDR